MRFLLALGVFALAALQSAAAAQTWYWCEPAQAYYPYVERCPVPWRLVDPSSVGSQPSRATQPSPLVGQPTPLLPTTPNRFPVLGDTLDDWCKTVQLPSSIAICSDRELRALTLERQQAFDEATARLNTEQQKTLLADQNSRVKSYAAACGLSQDFAPSLPLAPSVKECMAQAGRARIAYLRDATALGASPALSAPQPPSTAENGAPGKSTKTLTKTQPIGTASPTKIEASPGNSPVPIGDEQYRCRDQNTNFVYERREPCAKGDETLSSHTSSPASMPNP
jgi:hypothetical protein